MTTKAQPQNPNLRLPPLPDKLSSKTSKLVASYYSDCQKYETELAELNDRHRAMFEQAADLPIAEIERLGTELQNAKDVLRNTLVELAWRRREILPELQPDFAAAVDSAKRDFEGVIESEKIRYASAGVTAASLNQHNLNSGEIELTNRIKSQELVAIAAQDKLRLANEALDSLEAGMKVIPGWRSLIIPWPAQSGKHSAAVAEIAGLHLGQRHPGIPTDLPAYEAVAAELGFLNTILPDKHLIALLEIVELTGAPGPARPVFYCITQTSRAEKIIPLLEQLPETEAMKQMMFWLEQHGSVPKQKRKIQKTVLKV